MQITRVGVIGLGTMGAGIVEVFARSGVEVVGCEGTPELAEAGRGRVQASTDRLVAKGRMTAADQQELLGRVTCSSSLDDLAGCDLVLEAVPEVMSIKHDIFTRLDAIVRPDAILASNTSSLSLTEIAAGTGDPSRVVGMHFFNPAPILGLVEVITTPLTRPEVTDAVRDLALALGKKPVVVGDKAGFVANDLLFGYLNRAVALLEQGRVAARDLDDAMRVGAGLPMGPLTLMDLIGLDTCLHISHVMYDATHRPLHAPSALLSRMVTAGMLGRKAGGGFLTAPSQGSTDAPAYEQVAVVGDGGWREVFDGAVHLDDDSDLSALAGCQLVVEALEPRHDESVVDFTERVEDLLERVTEMAPQATIASVNASALDVAGVTGEGQRSVRLRLHAPTKQGRLVEVGRLAHTDGSELERMRSTFEALGLTVSVCRDSQGLVVDSLLFPYLNEAVRMAESGYATPADIDTAMVAGCGYPAGPFAMLDAMGAVDAALGLQDLHEASADPDLLPADLLVEHAVTGRAFL